MPEQDLEAEAADTNLGNHEGEKKSNRGSGADSPLQSYYSENPEHKASTGQVVAGIALGVLAVMAVGAWALWNHRRNSASVTFGGRHRDYLVEDDSEVERGTVELTANPVYGVDGRGGARSHGLAATQIGRKTPKQPTVLSTNPVFQGEANRPAVVNSPFIAREAAKANPNVVHFKESKPL